MIKSIHETLVCATCGTEVGNTMSPFASQKNLLLHALNEQHSELLKGQKLPVKQHEKLVPKSQFASNVTQKS